MNLHTVTPYKGLSLVLYGPRDRKSNIFGKQV